MSKILSISSQVIRGHVGNSAAVPALEALGHEVWPAPTIILSNHPAHGAMDGTTIEPETLDAMLSRLDSFGWLRELSAIATGYFRTPAQVEVAARYIAKARADNPDLMVLVDPVIGDHPKGLYVPEATAIAIREELLPQARTITPNRFELSWLAGRPVDTLDEALAAIAVLGVPETIVTSLPLRPALLSNLLVSRDHTILVDVPFRPCVPNGTGDLLSSLFLGHRLIGTTLSDSLARSASGVASILDATGQRDELDLTSASTLLSDAPRFP